MAREIPGFIYDASKGKYFRIQENHRNTQHVAQRDRSTTKYSREAVEGRRRLEKESVPRKKLKLGGSGSSSLSGGSRSTADSSIQTKSLRRLDDEIELRLRLGTGSSRQRMHVGDLVNERYAASLAPRPLSNGSTDFVSPMFTIDPHNKVLYSHTRSWRHRPEFSSTPLEYDCKINGEHAAFGYRRINTTSIFDCESLLFATPLTSEVVLWGTGNTIGDRSLNTSTLYSGQGTDLPWHRFREDFGDWGTTTRTIAPPHKVEFFGAATSGYGSGSADDMPSVAIATSRGVGLLYDAAGRLVIRSSCGCGRGQTTDDDHDPKCEVVSVAWQSKHIWLAGTKGGLIQLGDVRDPHAPVIPRIRTPYGGANHIASVGIELVWGVLSWGVNGAGVYDLRYCRDMLSTKMPNGEIKCSHELTDPLYTFDVTRYGHQYYQPLGWAYDDSTGIVAAAHSTYINQSKIALWDLRSGQLLTTRSAGTASGGALYCSATGLGKHNKIYFADNLADREFKDEVRCMQFVDLEGSATKSLVVSTEDKLDIWEV
ncbi:uncharacterized protein AB675_5464 [Cyphellophora attinorum]|uniref:Uncharacterized protein n=1 Tax=Cyphellophora attinorum TaxID=1664694 RepID=A0A0N0NNP8_9EURO|nr:uncharacterized protein AB675_5464 [Phialophora attinorum]KPI41798.1 hypothetical protein AB675_5464 [Phialophora attinorum]